MPATEPRLPTDEIARLGTDLYRRLIEPTLQPEDAGKFVAVEVTTGEYEVDEDDYAAVMRLHARIPGATVWLECAGEESADTLRSPR